MKFRMLFGLAAAMLLIGVVAWWWSSEATPKMEMPDPNGYTELAAVGERISGVPMDIEGASLEELRAFVESNRDELPAIRQALAHQYRVPVEYTPKYLEMVRVGEFKQIRRLLLAEGMIAEQEGRPSDAAKSYVDIMRAAHAQEFGGLLVDRLSGNGNRTIALQKLARVIDNLNPEVATEIRSSLVALQAKREPLENVLEHERIWSREAHGLYIYTMSRSLLQPAFQQVRQADVVQELLTSHVIDRLAARSLPAEAE